jgi:hypothetical protein
MIFPKKDEKLNFRRAVGGFFGLNTTVCEAEIIVEKLEYYCGEKARVRIICDNSRCNQEV